MIVFRFMPVCYRKMRIRLTIPLLIAMTLTMARADDLPDPFKFTDGDRVQTPADWEVRRKELQELIVQNEYGHLPPAPKDMIAVPLVSHTLKPLNASHKQFKLICDP